MARDVPLNGVENAEIARRLEEVAKLLDGQRANPFRVQAYRRAAESVRCLPKPLDEIWREYGDKGLRALTGVGDRMCASLQHLATTGRLPVLDRLQGEADPVALLESVPGIGPVLAERLHEDFGVASLEDLEAAAHDGRLHGLAGLGEKKLAGIRDSLATRLGRMQRISYPSALAEAPVEELLDVDRAYREKAGSGELPAIAPRRFNTSGEAWLPILHTQRGDRHYTALYSNTARAHQLDRVRDWVVLYYDHGLDERQCTVITAQRGALAGKRVVRGREKECEQYYSEPRASRSGS